METSSSNVIFEHKRSFFDWMMVGVNLISICLGVVVLLLSLKNGNDINDLKLTIIEANELKNDLISLNNISKHIISNLTFLSDKQISDEVSIVHLNQSSLIISMNLTGIIDKQNLTESRNENNTNMINDKISAIDTRQQSIVTNISNLEIKIPKYTINNVDGFGISTDCTTPTHISPIIPTGIDKLNILFFNFNVNMSCPSYHIGFTLDYGLPGEISFLRYMLIEFPNSYSKVVGTFSFISKSNIKVYMDGCSCNKICGSTCPTTINNSTIIINSVELS